MGYANDFAGSTADAAGNVAREWITQLQPPPPELRVEFETVLRRTRRTVVQVRNGTLLMLQRDRIRVSRRATIRLTRDPGALRSYGSSLQRLTRVARLAKVGGYASIGISLAIGGKDVYDDWDTSQRYRTISRTTGSLLGGTLGGGLSYAVCNAVLGLPSGFTSIFWCGFVAGGVGAVAGSKLGEIGGEKAYEFGSDIDFAVPRLRR